MLQRELNARLRCKPQRMRGIPNEAAHATVWFNHNECLHFDIGFASDKVTLEAVAAHPCSSTTVSLLFLTRNNTIDSNRSYLSIVSRYSKFDHVCLVQFSDLLDLILFFPNYIDIETQIRS